MLLSIEQRGELQFVGVVERAGEEEANVRIFPQYCDALKKIGDFSHIIILYWAHLRDNEEDRSVLQVYPKRHKVDMKVGVFACRSPSRPNPICLCVAKLTKLEGCVLTVRGLDAIEGSPVVDIKPYIPRADSIADAVAPEWTKHGPVT